MSTGIYYVHIHSHTPVSQIRIQSHLRHHWLPTPWSQIQLITRILWFSLVNTSRACHSLSPSSSQTLEPVILSHLADCKFHLLFTLHITPRLIINIYTQKWFLCLKVSSRFPSATPIYKTDLCYLLILEALVMPVHALVIPTSWASLYLKHPLTTSLCSFKTQNKYQFFHEAFPPCFTFKTSWIR